MAHDRLPLHHRFLRDHRDPLVASLNERQLLDLVRRHGAVTRADLSRMTGLTTQSIVRLVEELHARGMLAFGDAAPKGRGKPSPVVRLIPDYAYSLGVSITTDSVTLALINFAGEPLGQKVQAAAPLTRAGLTALLKQSIDEVLGSMPELNERLFGIGVAMTGFFIGDGSRLNPPSPLEDLALTELDRELEQSLGQPVWLDNDGNAAAIGESLLGAGREYKSFAYLYFSHGFGGGVVSNGECLRGVHGNAGEFAGMLPRQGLVRPTLELLRQMHNADGGHCPTIYALLEQFDPAWPAVERWIEQVAPSVSQVASAITAILDPSAIVLGGRMPAALAERLIPRIEVDNLPRRGYARPQPVIVAASAPGDAAAIGAGMLPWKQHFFL